MCAVQVRWECSKIILGAGIDTPRVNRRIECLHLCGSDPDRPKVFHNASFDSHVLHNNGITVKGLFCDLYADLVLDSAPVTVHL